MDDDGDTTSVVTPPYGQSAQTSCNSTYTSVGGTSQSSDANGNLTDNGTHLFLYDYKNHIVQVKLKSSGSVIASYRYDALGRRVEKNVGGTVERHILSIWNDPGVVEDLSRVVSVYDGSDAWKQNFVWSDEVDGIQMLEQKDVLDFDTDGNTTEVTRSFYHRNALGSVMEITDMNQAVVVSYRYDLYGKVTITRGGTPQSSDPLGNHWTFTGRFLDEEAGLVYYRARYYDAVTGRFLQRDPLGYDPAPSLFTYVASSPPNGKDPTGCDALDDRIESLEQRLDTNYLLQNIVYTLMDIFSFLFQGTGPIGAVGAIGFEGADSLHTLLAAQARDLLERLRNLRRLRRLLRGGPVHYLDYGGPFKPPPPLPPPPPPPPDEPSPWPHRVSAPMPGSFHYAMSSDPNPGGNTCYAGQYGCRFPSRLSAQRTLMSRRRGLPRSNGLNSRPKSKLRSKRPTRR